MSQRRLGENSAPVEPDRPRAGGSGAQSSGDIETGKLKYLQVFMEVS
jgi:hypothetical protein